MRAKLPFRVQVMRSAPQILFTTFVPFSSLRLQKCSPYSVARFAPILLSGKSNPNVGPNYHSFQVSRLRSSRSLSVASPHTKTTKTRRRRRSTKTPLLLLCPSVRLPLPLPRLVRHLHALPIEQPVSRNAPRLLSLPPRERSPSNLLRPLPSKGSRPLKCLSIHQLSVGYVVFLLCPE